MENELSRWLANYIEKSGVSGRRLAKCANISHTSIYQVINGERPPTYEFCEAIAGALGEDKEKLFRMAGLLPPLPIPDQEERKILIALRSLSPETQAIVVKILGALKETDGQNPLTSIKESAIIADNALSLSQEIEQFLVEFPELRSIMEEAQEHLSDVAIRALMANVEIVIKNPTERLRFIEFHKELSAVFDALTSTA